MMNRRSSPACCKSSSGAGAASTHIDDDHDHKDKNQRAIGTYGDASENIRFPPNHRKLKDYQYDRNTILIGIAIFVTYVFVNLFREILVLEKNTFAWTHEEVKSSIGLYSPNPVQDIPGKDKATIKYSNHQKSNDARADGAGFQQMIGLPEPPPAVTLPLEDVQQTSQASLSSTPSSLSTHNHLDLHSQNGTLVTLVHIGKTGGSALRDLIDYAVGYCRVNYLHRGTGPAPPLAEGSLFHDFYRHDKTTLQKHMCALARITNSKGNDDEEDDSRRNNGLIHLDRNLHKTQTQHHFLVPIRNPVDRLISWFHYERYFQIEKESRYSTALHDLIDPSRCDFSTVEELFLGKKRNKKDSSSGGKAENNRALEEGTSNTSMSGQDNNTATSVGQSLVGSTSTQSHDTTNLNSTKNIPEAATPEYCYKLSRACLSGLIPCYGHNFFNYEFYLEDILARILKGVAASRQQIQNGNSTTSSNTNTMTQNQWDKYGIPRVDVIRAERSWDDLNKTLLGWTGLPMTPDMDFFYLTRKPYDVDTHNKDNDKRISIEAASSLCETICPELVVYTKIIKYSSNLSQKEKKETKANIDTTCGFSVEEVCGKSFRYRKIREIKQSNMCEPRWRKNDEDEDEKESINVGDDIHTGGDSDGKNENEGNGQESAPKDPKDLQPTRSRHRRLGYLRGDDYPPC